MLSSLGVPTHLVWMTSLRPGPRPTSTVSSEQSGCRTSRPQASTGLVHSRRAMAYLAVPGEDLAELVAQALQRGAHPVARGRLALGQADSVARGGRAAVDAEQRGVDAEV